MPNEEKAALIGYVRVVHHALQALADEPNTDYHRLNQRRERADWQMVHILRELTNALPKDLRAEVQACLNLNERLWSADYSQACFQAQKEASSSCLAAVNSL